MKRLLIFVLVSIMIFSVLVSCGGTEETSKDNSSAAASEPVSESSAETSEIISEEVSVEPKPDENAKTIWKDEYADATNGIASPDDVYGAYYYYNDKLISDFTQDASAGDAKYIFQGKENLRFVNVAEGFAMTIPGTEATGDFSYSDLRSRIYTEKSVVTVSVEEQNPYNNNESGWETYLTEWIVPRIDDVSFLSANNIMRTSKKVVSTDYIPGYTVIEYDMYIKLSSEIEYPFYNIAIIRKDGVYKKFYLVVMKSSEKSTDKFQSIIKSMNFFDSVGESANHASAYEVKIPENWNEETKAYYNKIQNQTDVDWGFYYEQNNADYISWLKSAINYEPEIFMMYLHIGYYNSLNYLDSDLINTYAGGNGFNGKPVLNLTYQFTTTNNDISGYSPMFDILRGNYDDHFRKLAQDIKAYGKPVLFRLNNEMNTDWTSYSGIVTLLDPDIFVECWRRMYDIFVEEGVDNTIWIFNPITVTCPYCDWGEYQCYYPGDDYCQMLGVTYYEMGNSSMATFKSMYTTVYNKFKDYFGSFPWIIGEFACGAGGATMYDWGQGKYVSTTLGRNQTQQANWCREMFKCFANNQDEANEFCRNIKIAVWFSTNDYAYVNDKYVITNYLKLDERLTKTLSVFSEWLPKLHSDGDNE